MPFLMEMPLECRQVSVMNFWHIAAFPTVSQGKEQQCVRFAQAGRENHTDG